MTLESDEDLGLASLSARWKPRSASSVTIATMNSPPFSACVETLARTGPTTYDCSNKAGDFAPVRSWYAMLRSRFARTGPVVGPSSAKELNLAVGELSAREAERVVWDVIVVGTGMGGGMLGYSLARSGRRVLFVEKGRSTLPGTPGTIRAAMPELAEPQAYRSADGLLRRLGPRRTLHRRDRRHQRTLPEAVRAVHRQRHRRLLGPLRHGLRTILRPRFHPPAKLPRPRRFHRARGLADHL